MRKKRNKKSVQTLEDEALDRLEMMMRQCKSPAAVAARADSEGKKIVRSMSPAQMARMTYPDGKLVDLSRVPQDVIDDHLERYTEDELRRGQFTVVTGSEPHYVFIMDQQAKDKRDKEQEGSKNSPRST